MNNSNNKDTIINIINITRYVFLVVIGLVLAYFIIGQFFLPDEQDPIDSFTTMSNNWRCTNSSGNTEIITMAGSIETAPGDTVSATNTLPDNLNGINAFCFHAMWQDVKIYIDDELRAEYSTKNTRAFGNDSAVRFVFANIAPSDAGKEIRIETVSGTSYSGHFRGAYIGDKMGIFMHLFTRSIPKSIISLSMLILCLLMIVICSILMVFYKKHIPLIYLAWSLFFAAFWILSEVDLRQFVFRNVSVLSNMTFWSLMFIPPPLVIFINDTQKNRHKKIHFVPLVYQTIIIIVTSILQIFSISDFRNTLPFIHIGIVLSITSIFVSIILDIINKQVKEYYPVAFGLLGIVLGALLELYFFYNTVYTVGTSLSVALVFLLIMAAFKTIQDLLQSERDKQHAVLANEAKAKFLANMSHEIRTPINTVIGMNEMIIRENDNPAIAEYASYIESSSKMLLGLINDILDFSKIESGQYELIEGSYHLDQLLLDELNLLEARAHKKCLDIVLNADPRIPCDLWGDELRIKQIITNILTNAVKYTEKGSITIDASFTWIDNDTISLSIAIKDTGAGIKKENLDKLFESFTRIEEKKNRNIEGTGLGLNIAKMLVTLMNGQIDVESTYGEGSTFTVTIPQKVLSYEKIGDLKKKSVLLQNSVQTSKDTSDNKPTSGSTSDTPTKSSASVAAFTAPDAHILVVDDNEMNLAVIKGLLKRNLVQLDTALSGRRALELARETQYDIILMDHMMPELDGIETLELLRADETSLSKDSPVIALTANAIAGSHDMYIGYGFNDYISKPVDANHLEQTLMYYIVSTKKNITDKAKTTDNTETTTVAEATESNIITDSNETQGGITTMNNERPTNIIDKAVGLGYCGDSDELYDIIIATYYEQGLSYVNQVKEFYEAKDWHNYRIVVHALKSSSKNIGAMNFSEESLKQEMAAKEENEAFITQTFDEYYDNFLSLMDTVKNIIGA